MARAKKTAGKSPAHAQAGRPVPLAPTGACGERLLPALGALALVGAWLAALGGFSDGTSHIRIFMIEDTVRLLLFFSGSV